MASPAQLVDCIGGEKETGAANSEISAFKCRKITAAFLLITRWIADKKQAERTKRMPTGWIAPEELPANMMMTTPATGRKLKRIWRRVGNSFKKRAESPIARIGIRDNTTPVNMLLVRAMP